MQQIEAAKNKAELERIRKADMNGVKFCAQYFDVAIIIGVLRPGLVVARSAGISCAGSRRRSGGGCCDDHSI